VELHFFTDMLKGKNREVNRFVVEVEVGTKTGQLGTDVSMGDHCSFRISSSSTGVVQIDYVFWRGLSEWLHISLASLNGVIP
jgi:hypothetical protein